MEDKRNFNNIFCDAFDNCYKNHDKFLFLNYRAKPDQTFVPLMARCSRYGMM